MLEVIHDFSLRPRQEWSSQVNLAIRVILHGPGRDIEESLRAIEIGRSRMNAERDLTEVRSTKHQRAENEKRVATDNLAGDERSGRTYANIRKAYTEPFG